MPLTTPAPSPSEAAPAANAASAPRAHDPRARASAWVTLPLDFDVGDIVDGRYALIRLLGHGATGKVWLARDTKENARVAVKILVSHERSAEDDEMAVTRLLFEARVAEQLSKKTPHIVRVTSCGLDGRVPYLAMELLEGESLEDRLRRGRIDTPTLKEIVVQTARGLCVAHDEGIFHRDVKPGNIFLCTDAQGKVFVKLLDFGLARAVTARRKPATGRGIVVGTPSYMSPEQARGLSKVDAGCDVWGLAVIAYEGLAGAPPFPGETVGEVIANIVTRRIIPIQARRPNVGRHVERFFERAFAERVEDRFRTPHDFASAFAAMYVPEPDAERPAATPSIPPPRRMRTLAALGLSGRRSLAAIAGTAVIAAAMGAAIALVPALSRPPAPKQRPETQVANPQAATSPAPPEPLDAPLPPSPSVTHPPGPRAVSTSPPPPVSSATVPLAPHPDKSDTF